MQNARVEHVLASDPGRDPDKQINEDSAVVAETPFGTLAVVCDGMGGHDNGKEASQLAVDTIVARLMSPEPGASPSDTLVAAIREANQRVFSLAGAKVHGGRPGSTVVAILVHPHGTEVAHVGDSRAYVLRAQALAPLTRDHSKVQLLIDAGFLTPDKAETHPDAHQILRALGMAKEVEVELRAEPWPHQPGDRFLLCSDGLTDLVRNDELARALGTMALPALPSHLVELANSRGGHDNITVVAVQSLDPCLFKERTGTALNTEPLGGLGRKVSPTIDERSPDSTPTPRPDGTAPMTAAMAAVPAAVGSAPAVAAAPPLVVAPPRPSGHEPPRSRALVFVAVALGSMAFTALVAFVYIQTIAKPRHHTPHITGSAWRGHETPAAPASAPSTGASLEPEDLAPAPSASVSPLPPDPSAARSPRPRSSQR
jgi:serine/threonine protein phosphatase PrpC